MTKNFLNRSVDGHAGVTFGANAGVDIPVGYFNGKDIVYFDNVSFEINHHDLYCVSGKKIFSKGDTVSLKYVDLGRWAGFIDGNCIVELTN